MAGHLDDLRAELVRLGATGDPLVLPADLTVVQVGDLVHRGPESDAVVALVDHLLTHQPEQWVQLVGNHEAHYLRESVFAWDERISPTSVATLRRWWADGRMRVATSVLTDTEDFLITHAGLTSDFWHDVLGAPPRADGTAAALNALIGRNEKVLFRAGQMLRGRTNRAVGPVWAAVATELVPSWTGATVPFSQIHGHTTVVDWPTLELRADPAVTALTTYDAARKHETVTLAGGRLIGVDPGHGRASQRPWQAYVLEL